MVHKIIITVYKCEQECGNPEACHLFETSLLETGFLFLFAFYIFFQVTTFVWKFILGPVDRRDKNDAAIDKVSVKGHSCLLPDMVICDTLIASDWHSSLKPPEKDHHTGSQAEDNVYPQTYSWTNSFWTGWFIFSCPAEENQTFYGLELTVNECLMTEWVNGRINRIDICP